MNAASIEMVKGIVGFAAGYAAAEVAWGTRHYPERARLVAIGLIGANSVVGIVDSGNSFELWVLAGAVSSLAAGKVVEMLVRK